MADMLKMPFRGLRAALRRLKGFGRDRRGNIAMMFGLAAIPFFAFGGLAVDYSRAMMVKNRLGSALDATALAVAGQTGQTEAQLTASANAYFKANYPDSEVGRPSALRISYNTRDVTISADATVDTLIVGLIGYKTLTVSASAQVKKSSNSLEIGMVLDVTGSMLGSRITDLKSAATDLVNIVIWDDQSQYTSKVALVPFSMGVNVGAYADSIRGPITPAKAITAASWSTGTAKTITAANKANPIVITSNGHGFTGGETVYISGVTGMTQLNNKVYTVTYLNANTFSLKYNGTPVNSSSGYSTFTGGASAVKKCQVSDCGIVVTSASHGFNNGDRVVISGVAGTTPFNNAAGTTWTVANKTTNTFSLAGALGPNYTAYTSGGSIDCTVYGCKYLYFTAPDGTINLFTAGTCVTERIGANKYTDVAPSTSYVGFNYPSPNNPCLGNTITPMTSDKAALATKISALGATGSTSGQIGVAWGWYMISPDFGYLWPTASRPKPYDTDELIKIVVFMTDGDFNTPYCNGVIAADAGTGSGSTSDHINCNATNGSALTQASAQCEAMKADGVIVYTVGFDVASTPALVTMLKNCATDASHAYLAADGTALRAAFTAIAVDISNLRLSH